MHERMTNRWILRGAAATLGLSAALLAAGGAAYFRIARTKTESLRAWSDARCATYRAANPDAADPCALDAGSGRPVVPELQRGRGDLAAARAAIARGDDREAGAKVASALARVKVIDRSASMIGALVSSRLASEVLDLLEEAPRLSRDPQVRAALARTELASARRPLEAQRLRELRLVLDEARPGRFVTWGASDARIADRAERGDAILRAMETAARHGDVAACERVARQEGGLLGAPMRAGLCAKLVDVGRTSSRLARARAR